jgi:C1A family cysteine protease
MKKSKAFLSALMVLAVIFAFSGISFASGLKPVPLNPDFVSYREGTLKTAYPPSPIDWSYLKKARTSRNEAGDAVRATETLPAAFDLSALGRTPPVLNQKKWGTCWSFAAVETMEANLISRSGQRTPLSELHLAYFTYSFDDRTGLPGFTRTAMFIEEEGQTQNPIFDNGGIDAKVVAMLSRGTGPALEADAPYPGMGDKDPMWGLYLPPAPYAPSRFRLGEALCYPVNDRDAIKKTLMNAKLGALCVGYNAGKLINGCNYYSPEETVPDHAVLLVGWDDDYLRENFRSGDVLPAENGAWKIQNSWGTSAGDGGYFYISYEDMSFCADVPGALSLTLEPLESWDGIYSHDPLGQCLNIVGNGLSEQLEASVFEAERDEDIVAAGFITANEDMIYELQIYKDIPAGEGPDAGNPALSAPQTGEADRVGYRAVKLNEPVRVKKGERFAVVVKIGTKDGSEAYLPAEAMIPGYSDNASVSPGQSYVYFDADEDGSSEWADTYELLMDDAKDTYGDKYSHRNFNVNVKAFTVAAPANSGSGGGCSTSFGAGALMLLTVLTLMRKTRR